MKALQKHSTNRRMAADAGVHPETRRGAMRQVRRAGCIVHHKTELTPRNIDDPMITLNEDNLETVCRTCHAIIHEGTPPLADGLAFDADGNVIESAISPPVRR